MIKNDKISIIVPIYNVEPYINRCLDSIINQTYTNLEIICINDGSIDNSLNILKEYQKKDKRIKIIDKKNAGVSAARNDGIKKTTGEYITFVDSDDWLELDAIEVLYNALKKEKVDVVRGNYCINYSQEDNSTKRQGNLYNITDRKLYTNDKDFGTSVINKLIDGTIPCYVVLLLIKKEFLNNISFKENIHYLEDTIFYHELMNKIKSIYFLDKVTYHYYDNKNSATKSSKNYYRNIFNIIEANKYICNIIKKSKFYEEYKIQNLNATHLTFVMEYFYIMHKNSIISNEQIIIEINKLLNNKDIKTIIQIANIKSLPIRLRITMNLIINKKYKKLFLFYKFREIANKIITIMDLNHIISK